MAPYCGLSPPPPQEVDAHAAEKALEVEAMRLEIQQLKLKAQRGGSQDSDEADDIMATHSAYRHPHVDDVV